MWCLYPGHPSVRFFQSTWTVKITCGFEKITQGGRFGISCAASAKVMLSDSSQLQRRGIVSKYGVGKKRKSWLTKMGCHFPGHPSIWFFSIYMNSIKQRVASKKSFRVTTSESHVLPARRSCWVILRSFSGEELYRSMVWGIKEKAGWQKCDVYIPATLRYDFFNLHEQ